MKYLKNTTDLSKALSCTVVMTAELKCVMKVVCNILAPREHDIKSMVSDKFSRKNSVNRYLAIFIYTPPSYFLTTKKYIQSV